MLSRIKQKYFEMPVQMRASLWFILCSFLQKGVSTITTPIFTRLLTTSEYGNFSVFNSWLGIITVFVTLNLYSGVYTQGLVKYDEDRKVFSSSLQGLTFTLVVIWTCLYLFFHEFINRLLSMTTVQVLAMLVMVWTTASFNFWATEQRVELRYRKLVILTVIVSICKPVVGIIFVINAEDKVTARIMGLALVEIIGYSGLFFRQIKSGRVFFSARFWRYAVLFNLPLVPHYLSQVALNGADRIMIQRMCNSEEAGLYSLAYSVSQIMTLFNTAILQTINPWIYKKIKERKTGDIAKVAYLVLFFVGMANILLIAFAPEAIAIFAPDSYAGAIWVVPPVAMGVYFMFAYSLFADFEFYYEKTGHIAVATILCAILNIVLNYIFIDLFGYIAAGYTTLVCYVFYAVFHYVFMRKICQEKLDGQQPYDQSILMLITIAFLVTCFSFLLFYRCNWIRYGLIVFILVLTLINRGRIRSGFTFIMNTHKDR